MVACQAPLSTKFSRQEYWSGLPFPSPGDLPNPGIESGLLHGRQILYHLSHQGSPRHYGHSHTKKTHKEKMQSSYFPLAKFWNIQPSFHKQLDAIQAFVTLSPWQPTLVFLPGASQGQGSPMGCRLWGRTESDMTEATAAAATPLQEEARIKVIWHC